MLKDEHRERESVVMIKNTNVNHCNKMKQSLEIVLFIAVN